MELSILSVKDIEMFWKKVLKTDTCWLWQGHLSQQGGYGSFTRYKDKKRYVFGAHRLSYSLIKGDIPETKILRHSCDNPPCVNPDHLIAGTQKENAEDMISRGRHWLQRKPKSSPRGEQHWSFRLKGRLPTGEDVSNSKLTWDQVNEIKNIYKNKEMSQRQLSKKFGVSQPTILYVLKGRSWKEENIIREEIWIPDYII